jgi:aryl-alcohol dehydrogenase-like predicted oxidoreductase
VIPWSPLAGGLLTGRYRKGQPAPEGSRLARGFGSQHQSERQQRAHEARLDAVEELVVVADQAGVSLTHLAHAFVLEHPAVTSAIIGPRTMEHLESQLGAADVVLSADVLDRVDAITAPGLNWNPHDAGYQTPSIADPALRRR